MDKKKIVLEHCTNCKAMLGQKAYFVFDDGSTGESDGIIEKVYCRGAVIETDCETIVVK